MKPKHYYGDNVRQLFIAAAIVMLLTYPFFKASLPQGPFFMIVGTIILAIMAGLTSSKNGWAAFVDILISIFGVAFFENHAIWFAGTSLSWIFLTDQILTIIFIATLYFSIKTFRGMSSPVKDEEV